MNHFTRGGIRGASSNLNRSSYDCGDREPILFRRTDHIIWLGYLKSGFYTTVNLWMTEPAGGEKVEI